MIHRTAILVALLTASAFALEIGDEAPPVKVNEWVHGQGADPTKTDGKTVYVVEFWATWCPPCRASIPHLNKLNQQFKDQGVVIMGITREGKEKVLPFMKQVPMEYNVGLDDDDATSKAWMADHSGIPTAFVVGRDGKVAWAGHPMNGLDRVLEQVLAGKHDAGKARKIAAAEAQLQAAKSIDDYMAAANALIAADPANSQGYDVKLKVLDHQRAPVADRAAVYQAWAQGAKGDVAGQVTLVQSLLTADVALVDPQVMLDAARGAVEASAGKDEEAVASLAAVYRRLGWFEKAQAAVTAGIAARRKDGQESDLLETVAALHERIARVRQTAK